MNLFIKKLEQEYGKRDALTVTRGLVHDYLGMTVDFRVPFEVSLLQYDFVKKHHNYLPDSMKKGYRNSPAPENLFKQNDDDVEIND